MTMDYGSSMAPDGANGMAKYAISAAENTYLQAKAAGLTNFKIGITPMIGKNDVAGEVFTIANANELVKYLNEQSWVGWLSMWSANRDVNDPSGPLFKSSQIQQSENQFINIFKEWPKSQGGISAPVVKAPEIVPIPEKVFAPFCDILLWPTFDIAQTASATNSKWFTLSFITADGSGNPAWGSSVALSQKFYLNTVKALRANGGDVIISFGGAIGQELGVVTTDVDKLVAKYQSVIDMYGIRWADFDIEGAATNDLVSIDRRTKALKKLKEANPGLKISYTLPVFPTGLTSGGVEILKSAKAIGLQIDGN